MSLEAYTEQVRNAVGDKNLGPKTIKFAFNEGGVLMIDGSNVSNDDVPAACTVKVGLEDFGQMLARKANPMTLFMAGRIKIEGDMSVAMKLGNLFQG